ncbi:hypothetical protein ACFX13_003444 [Malus domestica]
MPLQQAGARPAVTTSIALETSVRPPPAGVTAAEWREHTSADGRRRTSLSTWEKPFGLMTPMERADASTNWKEFTSPDGRKYYYYKVTKESRWTMP